MSNILLAGTPAPDFTLHATPDQTLTLKGLRGRPVILAFYPADWSPVYGDQMALYNEVLPEFQRFNAELLGISVDGVWCHAAFSRDRKLHFPLLADFEPKGAVAKLYGAFRDGEGIAEPRSGLAKCPCISGYPNLRADISETGSSNVWNDPIHLDFLIECLHSAFSLFRRGARAVAKMVTNGPILQ
jgi:peroxiredoxin